MADPTLLKVASVLEKAADLIDSHEAEKTAAVKTARTATVKALTARFSEITGEDLPSDVAEKLASDETALSTVQKLLEKTASNHGVESLGGSSESPESGGSPKNKKEAREAAWNSFGNFINNS